MTDKELSPQKIAEILGSEPPIYVGEVSFIDLASGGTSGKVEAHKRAREVAHDSPDSAIGGAIAKLAGLIDVPRGPQADLTPTQKDAVAGSIVSLLFWHERYQDGGADEATVIRGLFDEYFVYQSEVAETPAGHVLRVLGDDFAIETGFDLDQAWEIYLNSLEANNRGR